MNKRFLLAWLVLFVAWFIGSFVVHGVLPSCWPGALIALPGTIAFTSRHLNDISG